MVLQVSPPDLITGASHLMKTVFTFHEFEADFSLHSEVTHTLDGYAFVHDFAITQGHIVIMQNALDLDLPPFLNGTLCPIHCLLYHPKKPLLVHLIKRSSSSLAQPHPNAGSYSTPAFSALDFTVPDDGWGQGEAVEEWGTGYSATAAASTYTGNSQFVQHIANAWETEGAFGTDITVQYVAYKRMPNFDGWSGPGRRWQDVDPDAQPCSQLHSMVISTGLGSVKTTMVSPRVCEFPKINPTQTGQPTRYVYTSAAIHPVLNRPQQAIASYDTLSGEVDMWTRGWRYYVGEVEFVPRSRLGEEDEQAGWLLCMCYDAVTRSSEVVVLDAANVSSGPVAVVKLPTVVPHGLHGTWVASRD